MDNNIKAAFYDCIERENEELKGTLKHWKDKVETLEQSEQEAIETIAELENELERCRKSFLDLEQHWQDAERVDCEDCGLEGTKFCRPDCHEEYNIMRGIIGKNIDEKTRSQSQMIELLVDAINQGTKKFSYEEAPFLHDAMKSFFGWSIGISIDEILADDDDYDYGVEEE